MPLHPVVKNTFLCFDDVGALTPVRKDRRIHSAGAVLLAPVSINLDEVALEASALEGNRGNDGTAAACGGVTLS